jgi:RNA polymerase sigma factor (sigma-70 family)
MNLSGALLHPRHIHRLRATGRAFSIVSVGNRSRHKRFPHTCNGAKVIRIPKDQTKVLTKEETEELIRQAQAGSLDARNKVLLANIGIIILVIGERHADEMTEEDIFIELFIAAIAAVKNFRPDKGSTFPSYLAFCLRRQAIKITARQKIYFHISDLDIIKYHKVKRNVRALGQRLGTEPTVEQIAAASEIPEEDVARFPALDDHLSIDQEVGGEDGAIVPYIETIGDTTTTESIETFFDRQALRRALVRLEKKPRRILWESIVAGLSPYDTAKNTKLTIKQIRLKRRNAIKALRKLLAEGYPELLAGSGKGAEVEADDIGGVKLSVKDNEEGVF